MTKLLWFDFEIRFHPGLDNKAADTLSPVPHHSISLLQLLTLPYPVDLEQLHDQIQLDPYLKSLYTDLLATPSSHPGFSILQVACSSKIDLLPLPWSPLFSFKAILVLWGATRVFSKPSSISQFRHLEIRDQLSSLPAPQIFQSRTSQPPSTPPYPNCHLGGCLHGFY